MSFKANKKTQKGFTPVVNFRRLKSTTGFTLLEILLVVGIIAVLAGIVIVAINPGRQLAQTRNAERKSDIKQIKSAMEQFYIDKGYYPASTTLSATTTLLEVCDTGATSSPSGITCTNMIDLSELVPVYITAIPKDPQATTTNSAGYKVAKDVTNKLITTAPQAELSVFIAIGTSTPVVASTLGDGLIAHYKMNDTNCDTVVDSQGNHNGSGTCTATTGKISGALSFNGSGNNVNLGDVNNAGFDAYSVSFWLKAGEVPGGNNGWQFPISNDNSSDNGATLEFAENGNSWARMKTSDNYFDLTGGTISRDTWYHFILIADGSHFTMYTNGVQVAQADYTGTILGQGQDWYLGRRGNLASNRNYWYYNGKIDDVRIYNRVLTPGEIAELAAGTEAE